MALTVFEYAGGLFQLDGDNSNERHLCKRPPVSMGVIRGVRAIARVSFAVHVDRQRAVISSYRHLRFIRLFQVTNSHCNY